MYFIIVRAMQNPETIDWSQYWNPQIYVDNTVGDPKETIGRSVLYDINTWKAFFVQRHRLKGTFLENLELFHFPFDTQVGLCANSFSSANDPERLEPYSIRMPPIRKCNNPQARGYSYELPGFSTNLHKRLLLFKHCICMYDFMCTLFYFYFFTVLLSFYSAVVVALN